MNKFFLFFLLLLPSLAFASFPLQLNYSDTIRKDGKVYIIVDENPNKVLNNKYEQVILEKTKHEMSQKNKNRTIVGSLVSLWIIAVIIASILLILLFKAFWDSLNSY
jgi:hypothetical protein